MKDLKFNSIQDVLRYAIQEEQNASDLYLQRAQQTIDFELKSLWEQLARDEMRHKVILTDYLENSDFVGEKIKSDDFAKKIAPVPVEPEHSEYQRIIISAVNAELQAYNMYVELANHASDEEMKRVLLSIATDELNHKESLLIDLAVG